ncbi:hypothetical protein AB0F72_41590 [Actinoplanes sp. NPDC023936]|uniref:hypothetical protein n=1 Tax=Actinoplanes sp. NPDC023936 TaxID=3154910 RepID=UPI003406CFC8
MDLDRFRPRSEAASRLTLFACLLAPSVVAAIGSLRSWQWWNLLVFLAVGLGLAAVFVRGFTGPAARETFVQRAAGVALLVAAFVLGVSASAGTRLTVLEWWGRPTTVTVQDVRVKHDVRRDRSVFEFCFRVARLDGSPVFGDFCRSGREWREGMRMEVLLEPTGFVAPETPEEVSMAGTWRTVGLVSIAVMGLSIRFVGGMSPERSGPTIVRRPDPGPRHPRMLRPKGPGKRGRGR